MAGMTNTRYAAGILDSAWADSKDYKPAQIPHSPVDKIIKRHLRNDSLLSLAQAAICLPVGQTGFFHNRRRKLVMVVEKQTEDNFVVTFRDRGRAGITVKAVLKDGTKLQFEEVYDFLGTLKDIAALSNNADRLVREFGAQLTIVKANEREDIPCLDRAGAALSPERDHYHNNSRSGWKICPAT